MLFDLSEFTLLAVFYGALVIIIPVIYWIIYPIRIARRYLHEQEPLQERQYIDYKKTGNSFSRCLADEHEIYLSLIIPAFNEEKRIRSMLETAIEYLLRRQRQDKLFDYEIIVVDDCSQDDTIGKVQEIMRKHQTVPLKLLALKENHGKGGAVRKGMLVASGLLLLMADADGATKFDDFCKLENNLLSFVKDKYLSQSDNGNLQHYIDQEKMVICGSRAHLQEEAMAHRHWIRNWLMYCFHFAVSSLCIEDIKDTQCGFKLFTRKAAQLLFPPLHVERWAFDVELLYLAKIQNVKLNEVPVEWHEIEGSKLNIISASLTMLRELVLIRICYAIHLWNVTDGLFRLCPTTSSIRHLN